MWESIAEIWRTGWDFHPPLLLSIAALVALYAGGAATMGRRLGRHVPPGRGAVFALGVLTLFLALHSPLHHLAEEYLFSAHAVQHLLLTLVIPPLLLLGTPGWLLTGSPLGGGLSRPWLVQLLRSPAYPVVAFLIFNLPFAYVHFPVIYDAIFGNEVSHRVTHVAFLGTGILTWLPLLSPAPEAIPRLSQPAQMLYCFFQTLPGSLVGSLLTLSDRVLYREYLTKALGVGVSPLADQQVGGLLMWVVGGTFWLVVLTVIFYIWAAKEERQAYG